MTQPYDNDQTVIRPPAGLVSPPAAGPHDHDALPIGSRIDEFEITRLIGVGGFGIVYLAHDHSLGRMVALKEYMPSSLASRTERITVRVKSARDADTFAAGLRSFINEARLLAQFDHPALVKVYRFWEANGTAYLVMPYYEGLTLKQTLLEMGQPPSEAWLQALLAPLMDALQVLHKENCFHRDIAPDNILMLPDGRPVLLDFGAARRVIGDMANNLTVILKPGYAPIEQYAEDPLVRQGAWTDIYALAAVVRYAITGKPPMPSVARMINDTLIPLEQSAQGRYGASFLRAMDLSLSVKPEHRPQGIDALRKLLGQDGDTPRQQPARRPDAGGHAAASDQGKGRLVGWVALGGAISMALVGGIFLFLNRAPLPSPAAVVPGPVAPVAVSDAGPAPTPTAQTPPAASPTLSTPPVQAAPVDPVDVLGQIFERRQPNHIVDVTLDQARVRIGKDQLRFKVQSGKPGYLYLLAVGTDKGHFHLLFPNELDRNNQMVAGKPLSLPRAGWEMTASGPPGRNQFVAMVSEHPRDFSAAGLIRAGSFAEFPMDAVAALWASGSGAATLAGKPVCPSTGNCSDAFGAARFAIEEVD